MDYKLQRQKQFYEERAKAEQVLDGNDDGRGHEDIYNKANMPPAISTGMGGLQGRFWK